MMPISLSPTMRRLGLLVAVPLLAACENSAHSYVIDDTQNHSISLIREQQLAWSDKVDQYVVVARFPECQKRVAIDAGTEGGVAFELYQFAPMRYVGHQGPDWYAISTEICDVQRFEQAPATPGRLLGQFEYQGESLQFVPAPGAAGSAN